MKTHINNFKADGAIGGGIAFAIVGDHENRGMGGGYVPMIVIVRRFSDVRIYETETAPTLEQGAGGTAWSLDEKMGQTYVHRECANTLAQRDYKQPQAVIYELSRNSGNADGVGISETRNAGSDE